MVQIERLTGENWRCFKTLDMEIHPRMVFVSKGPGPGKSTLLDAVIYNVLGSCRGTGLTGRGSEALRMVGTDVAMTELGLRDDEGLWQLGRRVGKSGGPYMREDGGAKITGPNLRFEEAFGIPAPAAFPSLRPREFLEMPHEERERIVLTACGTFRVAAMIEKAGDLWPEGWEHAAVVKLVGKTDALTVKDGMQRIHNKAKAARQAAAVDVRDARARVEALSSAAEDVAPEVKPPSAAELTEAQAAVTTAGKELAGLRDKRRDYDEAERVVERIRLDAPEEGVESQRVGLKAIYGRKGALIPKLQKARDAIAEMNNLRAKESLPPIHTLEELGSPPAINETLLKLAKSGCPACVLLEEKGAQGECPHKEGDPQVVAHIQANERAVRITFATAKVILAAEVQLKQEFLRIEREITDAEAVLDAGKEHGKQLKAANAALTKIGDAGVSEEDVEAAIAAQNQAQERLSELKLAEGAGGAAKGVKGKATAAKRARTKATKVVDHWQALEAITDPAGQLAQLWMASIGGQFADQLPEVSEALAPEDKLPPGVEPIRAYWHDSECQIVRRHGQRSVGVPWRLASRGEQCFGAIAVAVTWALVTGCLLVAADDVDALGNLLPLVLDGLYGSGEAGNILVAGVGATMTAALEAAGTGDSWVVEEVSG